MTDLLEEHEAGVAVLTLNRPDRLNALSEEMLRALCDALPRLNNDKQIGAIILTGAGRGFCAGGDVKRMAAAEQSMEERQEGAALAPRIGAAAAHHRQGGDRRGEWPGCGRRARHCARV